MCRMILIAQELYVIVRRRVHCRQSACWGILLQPTGVCARVRSSASRQLTCRGSTLPCCKDGWAQQMRFHSMAPSMT